MEWLNSVFGENNAGIATTILAILAALFIAWLVYRIVRSPGGHFSGSRNTRAHRLEVVDATAVDNRRRLVLVRCDEREHLVLIGGMNDLVIDKDVTRNDLATKRAPEIVAVDEPALTPEPAPEPEIEIEEAPVAPVPQPAKPEPRLHREPEPEQQATPAPVQTAPEPARQEARRSTDRAWTRPTEPPLSGRRMTDVANLAAPAATGVAAMHLVTDHPGSDRASYPASTVDADRAPREELIAERSEIPGGENAPEVAPVRPAMAEAGAPVVRPVDKAEPTLEDEIEAEMDRLISNLQRD